MSFLLLLVVLTFSKCKKGSDEAAPFNAPSKNDTTIAAVAGASTTGAKTLDVTKATSDGGFSYKVYNDLGSASDNAQSPAISTVRIFENGKELGPAHSQHADIRTIGKGRFSHWSSSLYFSSSDNTDPRTNGRTYTYTTTAGTVAPVPPAESGSVTTPATGIIGFAMVDGSTTGGISGKTVVVSTLSDLKNALESSAALIIKVSGKITGSGFLNVKSNKTVQGLKGSSLEGVGLMVYGTSNIIIQNMTIRNVVSYSNIIIKEGAHHVWVDHCDLSSDRNHGWDYYDGLLDVGKRADYISLSWNKLHDNHIPMLIGFGDENTDDIGHLRVTVYNNYFYNVSERQPGTRFGYIHVFNNYMQNGSGYAIGASMGATVRIDNNYFENQAIPLFTEYNAKPGYISGTSTNIFKSCGASRVSTAESNWVPTYAYKASLIAAANVPAVVTAGAGATLNL